MVKCAKCGKEFKPPKDYWRYCYNCWIELKHEKKSSDDLNE